MVLQNRLCYSVIFAGSKLGQVVTERATTGNVSLSLTLVGGGSGRVVGQSASYTRADVRSRGGGAGGRLGACRVNRWSTCSCAAPVGHTPPYHTLPVPVTLTFGRSWSAISCRLAEEEGLYLICSWEWLAHEDTRCRRSGESRWVPSVWDTKGRSSVRKYITHE